MCEVTERGRVTIRAILTPSKEKENALAVSPDVKISL